MPGPISRDTIAKCSPGNDLYAMIKSPHMKMPTQSSPTQQVDTIKSLKHQMEREALASLGKSMQSFIVVARAGRFLFLAIALPPYLLMYGFPKWLLVDLLPNLFNSSFKPFKIFNDQFKKLFKEETSRGVISDLKNLWSQAVAKGVEYLKWIDKASKALFVHLKHQKVALGYRLLAPYLPFFDKGMQAAESAMKMLLDRGLGKGKEHLQIARTFTDLAWKMVKQGVMDQFRPFVEKVQSTFSRAKEFVEKIVEKPKLELEKLKTAITENLKKAEEVFKSTGQNISKAMEGVVTVATSYIARPLVEWANPKIQWASNAAQYGQAKLGQQWERMRGFIQNVSLGVKDLAKAGTQVFVEAVRNVFDIIPAALKQFFNPEGGFKKKAQEWMEGLNGKLKQLKKTLSKGFFDSIEAAKNQGLKFYKTLVKAWKSFLYQLKMMPKRLIQIIKRGYRFTLQTSHHTSQFFRWIVIWGRVLGRLAWQELRQSVSLLTSRLPFSE